MSDRAQAAVHPWSVAYLVVGVVVLFVGAEVQHQLDSRVGPGTDLCGCGLPPGTMAAVAATVGIAIALLGIVLRRYQTTDSTSNP